MTWAVVVKDHRGNDIWVRLRCEQCGLIIAKASGYNDQNWWENVLQKQACPQCSGETKMPRKLGLSSLGRQVSMRAGLEHWNISQELSRHGKRWRIYIAGIGFADGDTPAAALRKMDAMLGGAA